MKLPALPDRSNFFDVSDSRTCGSAYSPPTMLLQGQTLVTLDHGGRCANFLVRDGAQRCRRLVCDGTLCPSQLAVSRVQAERIFRSGTLILPVVMKTKYHHIQVVCKNVKPWQGACFLAACCLELMREVMQHRSVTRTLTVPRRLH